MVKPIVGRDCSVVVHGAAHGKKSENDEAVPAASVPRCVPLEELNASGRKGSQ